MILGGFFAYVSYLANQKLPIILGERVDVENLDISIFGNNVLFNNPSFEIDSSKNKANVRIVSKAKSISIEGFSFWDLLVSNKLGVDKLTIDTTQIHLQLPERRPSNTNKKEIHFFVTEIFTSIGVEKLEIVHADILVTKKGTSDTLLNVKGFRLTAEKIIVDTATVNNIFPLEFERSVVQMDGYRIRAGEDYRFSGRNLEIKDTTITVQDLKFESIYSREEFPKHQKHEKAQVDLEVAGLSSKNLLWDLDSTGFSIRSTRFNLDQANLSVYKDKRPTTQSQEIKPLLTGMIMELPFTLTIDTLTVLDSYIEYEQFPVRFPRSGKVFFDKMYVSAYNVTNDSIALNQSSKTLIDVETDFMGEGKLWTNIQLDLRSPKQDFTVKGKLGTLPVTYVNQVMTPLVGVTAEGTVHEVNFEFNGDEYDASGLITCEYTDLNITKYDDTRDKEFLKSILGNLILRNNNRKEDSLGYKEGEIYFIRYQNKNFFNYLWNSVRVGLMDIVVPFYKNPDRSRDADKPKYKEDKSEPM
ncbi:MAG: hypothetical protein RIC35_00125 [Marinoscillum sp.]